MNATKRIGRAFFPARTGRRWISLVRGRRSHADCHEGNTHPWEVRGSLAVDGTLKFTSSSPLSACGRPAAPGFQRPHHISSVWAVYRETRSIAEHGVNLVFVFDGTPPPLKAREVAKRRAVRQRYEEERDAALARGDTAAAYSKATMTSRLTREMVAEARELLRLMGIPDGPGSVGRRSPGRAHGGNLAGDPGRSQQGLRLAPLRRAALVRFLGIAGKSFCRARAPSVLLRPRRLTSPSCSRRFALIARG